MKKIIISGGGTGGHIYPAIAIANALRKLDPDVDILFVGAEGKMEMEKVPKAGYPIKGLWISGFQRKFTLGNLLFPLKLLFSLFKAGTIIRNFRPDAVVGVGGYASGPLLQVATSRGIPALIQEQNSYPGITNKILAKKVDKICVAYPDMDRFFPAGKIIITGNPVRQDILDLDGKREEAFSHFGFNGEKKTLFVTGGSLGARTLNEAIAAGIDILKQKDIQVLWQAGKLYLEEFEKRIEAHRNIRLVDFVDRMDLAYAMADVVVCRAGALTISELCLAAKPAILVPSPNVAEDHQTANAVALEKKDAAWLVKDKEAIENLVLKAVKLLDSGDTKAMLAKNIKSLAKAGAADQIAEEVMALIKPS